MDRRWYCCVIAATVMAGCANKPPPDPDPIALALADSAERIADAWTVFGAVQEAAHPETRDFLGDYQGKVPAALQEKISIQWAGPLAGLIKTLALSVGWQFAAIGLAPPNGIPVFVDARQEAIANIIRDAGYQAGERATVIVKPDELRLEVIYD